MKDDVLRGNRKIRFPVRHCPDVPSSQGWMLVGHNLFCVVFTLIFGDEFHEKSCGYCWHFPKQADKALPSASCSPGGIHVGCARPRGPHWQGLFPASSQLGL